MPSISRQLFSQNRSHAIRSSVNRRYAFNVLFKFGNGRQRGRRAHSRLALQFFLFNFFLYLIWFGFENQLHRLRLRLLKRLILGRNLCALFPVRTPYLSFILFYNMIVKRASGILHVEISPTYFKCQRSKFRRPMVLPDNLIANWCFDSNFIS